MEQNNKVFTIKPKVLKVKTRKSFNRKPKVTQKLTYESFLYSLQLGEYDRADELLIKTLRLLTPKERVNSIVSYMEKTPYSSFTTVLKNLKRLLQKYEEHGNKSELETYLSNLVNSGEGGLYRNLLLVREGIIQDLIHDSAKDSARAVEEMIIGLVHEIESDDYLENNKFEDMFDKNMKDYLIHLASIIWPEAKGLKVLFGKSNEST